MTHTSSFVIPPGAEVGRADRVLAESLPGRPSRSAVTGLLRQGRVLVNGRAIRPSTVLKPGDVVEITAGEPDVAPAHPAETPQIEILFEDEDLVVLDKPAGLVVHPGAGRAAGTLMDALVRTRPDMVGVGEPGRWGIVHRLDRDTSGVMVVAKTILAHATLSAQFKEHSIHRVYLALVRGNPGKDQGVIDAPLGRHAKDRKRISTSTARPRAAMTRWNVRERLGELTLLEVKPQTGRTHQIRVHLSSIGLPVFGDPVYGKTRKTASVSPMLCKAAALMKRQALHAAILGFIHPRSAQPMEFTSPMPEDMTAVLTAVRTPGQ
jgi:23S rRNA pseudouridine1911/1915/1917 synthase